jgi:hypothetical protein
MKINQMIPLEESMNLRTMSTTVIHEDSDSLEELSEYLDVLSSSAAARILNFLKRSVTPVPFQRRSRTSAENTKTS